MDRTNGLTAMLLGIRFLAELGMLAALAWGGWFLGGDIALSLVLALLLPVVAATVWSRWVAPRARHRLTDPARLAVEVVLFVAAAYVVANAEPHPESIAFGLGVGAAFLISMPARRVDV
jgi:hypothetical protein